MGRPVDGQQVAEEVEFPGQARSSKLVDRVNVPVRSITEGYFDVMGMTIAEGRAFRDTDGPEAPRVAIVNATLAKRYYADRNPVGAHFQFAGGGDKPVEIVGVVADTPTEDLVSGPRPRSTCRSGNPARSQHCRWGLWRPDRSRGTRAWSAARDRPDHRDRTGHDDG